MDEDARGRDDAYFVAKMAAEFAPPTHYAEDSRERLAKILLDGAHSHERDKITVLTLTRMATALMGQVWVDLYCKALEQR